MRLEEIIVEADLANRSLLSTALRKGGYDPRYVKTKTLDTSVQYLLQGELEPVLELITDDLIASGMVYPEEQVDAIEHLRDAIVDVFGPPSV